MKKILRSVIDVDGEIPQESLLRNFVHLVESEVVIPSEEDREIWQFVRDYARNYSAIPTVVTVRDFFERNNELTVLDRLEEIANYHSTYQHSDFENLIAEEISQQKDQEMHVILKTANDILFDGMTIKQGRESVDYQGHRGSMKYIMSKADDMMRSGRGRVTKSNIVMDTDEVRQEFDATLASPQQTWGIITGLANIDTVCRGIKPGELWIHAGFTGELKTTMALNWAYRAAFLLQNNVYYMSLEMPVDQIRKIIYVMHSTHPKFQGQGWPRLSYRLVRDGEDSEGNRITDEQIEFFNHIIDDIEENRGKSYGSFIVRSPDEEITVPKLRTDMEITHQQTPLHMTVIDHFALMRPEKSTRNYYTDLNSIIRDTKRLALSFNEGERMPILGLLQINRQGKLEAERNEGVYKMQALADANEAERSSDVITTTFLDEPMRTNGTPKFGCLKNRDNPHFVPFQANIDWSTKHIYGDFEYDDDLAVVDGFDQDSVQALIRADRIGSQAASQQAGGDT